MGNMRALSSRQFPVRGLIKTLVLMVFVPGLKDKPLIGRLCAALEMPVNIVLDAPLTPIDLETVCNVVRKNGSVRRTGQRENGPE